MEITFSWSSLNSEKQILMIKGSLREKQVFNRIDRQSIIRYWCYIQKWVKYFDKNWNMMSGTYKYSE